MDKHRIAIFASGTGSNASLLIEHFSNHEYLEVAFVLTNKENAGVIIEAKNRDVTVLVFSNEQVEKKGFLEEVCLNQGVDAIVLAGYLRKLPLDLIKHYAHKIINIHPSLLPKFGGSGMYGSHVHKAVLDANELQSGITMHFVDEEYDSGQIIAQFYCSIATNETTETLALKLQRLEHVYFAKVVDETLTNTFKHV